MTNSNGFDPMAQYARLSERVENQGKDIVDLRSNMNTGFQGVNANLAALSNELRSNSKTQWPVIWAAAGVCFTVLVTIGTFFYSTLSKGQDRLDTAIVKSSEASQASISKLAETTQNALTDLGKTSLSISAFQDFRAAYENNRIVSRNENIDKFGAVKIDVDKIKEDQVPRKELDRVWMSYDQRFSDQQRQIDEVKQTQAGIYGARDVLMDMRERLDRLERDRARAAQSASP